MLKLFAVMLGGRAPGCNTELHDTVFVVGESLQACYPQLVQKWFGSQARLHIDASQELNYIDGHAVQIKDYPSTQATQLFFVNFGGYKTGFFGEVHEAKFYVAAHKTQALERARTDLCLGLSEQHCDDNLCIDDMHSISQVDNYYVHLLATTQGKPAPVQAYYRRLDKAESTTQLSSPCES